MHRKRLCALEKVIASGKVVCLDKIIALSLPNHEVIVYFFNLQLTNRLKYHDTQYYDGIQLTEPQWLLALQDILLQMKVQLTFELFVIYSVYFLVLSTF